MPMNKTKGHRKTASLGQGSTSIGELGPEWTEEVDQVTCDQQALEVLDHVFCGRFDAQIDSTIKLDAGALSAVQNDC